MIRHPHGRGLGRTVENFPDPAMDENLREILFKEDLDFVAREAYRLGHGRTPINIIPRW